MIDALMRIRFNGPKKLSHFKAMDYAKYWTDTQLQIRVDDPLGGVPEDESYSEELEELKKDNIYFEDSLIF